MSALQKEIFLRTLPPLPMTRRGGGSAGSKVKGRRGRDYSPLPWSSYFDRSLDISVAGGDCFRVYCSGSAGPALLLLHGGGHSALSWAVFARAVTRLVECQVMAVDFRGHGDTVTADTTDLSADSLTRDVRLVAERLFGETSTPVVLLGHSMGGAIAVRAAAAGAVPNLVGLTVIDVVEGTAVDSLTSMQGYLRGRPASFRSLEHAVEWSIRSGQLRNVESARVSMPGQLKRVSQIPSPASSSSPSTAPPLTTKGDLSHQTISEETTDQIVSEETADQTTVSKETANQTTISKETTGTTVSEEVASQRDSTDAAVNEVSDGHHLPSSKGTSSDQYTWRIDLSKTECFWRGWFDGLSRTFLSTAVPKMLILAGVDRLDKELTIGQMQGKFQMMVLSGCGHSVHEDSPDKVAGIISDFLIRYKLTERKADQDV